MKSILIVEDDDSIRSVIALNLKRNNYETIQANSSENALKLLETNEVDIAILDIMLPGMNGLELCEELRDTYPQIGIILLTAKAQEHDKIEGLEKGADDYLTKPFSPGELLARVNALHRRIKKLENNYIEKVLKNGKYTLNISNRTCHRDEEEIVLTPTEFLIVKLFFEKTGETLSREYLLNQIWGENFYGDIKIVDVNIRRLRRKLEADPSNPEYIETVWGKGYRWKNEK